ncbi:MAG: hypothetical protein ACREVR_14995, partial [Burkholderiales bacterium]
MNFNPHVHVLAADRAFLPDGTFVALPPVPEELLAEGLRRAVLGFLAQNGAISATMAPAEFRSQRPFPGQYFDAETTPIAAAPYLVIGPRPLHDLHT